MAETWNPKDNYAPDGHNHDDRYSKVGHSHDGIGDLPAHDHGTMYSKYDHNHDDRYSLKDHDHNDDYAPYDHDHDDKYAPYHDHEDFVTITKFEDHVDSDLHLKDGERDKWNNKVGISEYDGHRDDTSKHVTQDLQDKWNAKSDAHDHPYAPLSHVGDDTHVSSDDKKKWNDKEDKGHTHVAKDITGVAAYVIESGNNIETYTADNKTLISRSWYRKWSDGTLEQGGWYWGNEVGGEADTIVNLTESFNDTTYHVSYTACTNGIVGGSEYYHHTVYSKTVDSFYVQDNNLFARLGLDWYARGTYKTTAT